MAKRIGIGEFIDRAGDVWDAATTTVVEVLTPAGETRYFVDAGGGTQYEVWPSDTSSGASGIGADEVISGTTTSSSDVPAVVTDSPSGGDGARRAGGDSEVAVATDSTGGTTTGGGGGGGTPPPSGGIPKPGEPIPISAGAIPSTTKDALGKRNINWKLIIGVVTIGGIGYWVMSNGDRVKQEPGETISGGSNPNGIRPDDDPGGIGDRVGGGGGTTTTTTTSSGGGGGGGGSSSGGGGTGMPAGFGSDDNYYPVLPMTEQRRKMLLHASAVYGRPMGGFRTPPGGWDPRMEAMFTTGAFEPQMASQEEIDAYRNKPKPQLPKLPNSSASLDNLPSGPTVPGGSWQQQSSFPRGGSGSSPSGYGNIPVPRPNAKPNSGASPASFTKPAGAAPAASGNQPPSWADLMGRTSPATKMTGQTPSSTPAPANTMQAQNWWNQVANPSTGSYDFTNAPFPPGFNESPDAYAQRLASTGFPVYNGSTTPPAKSTSTAPLSYQDMLSKLRGQ